MVTCHGWGPWFPLWAESRGLSYLANWKRRIPLGQKYIIKNLSTFWHTNLGLKTADESDFFSSPKIFLAELHWIWLDPTKSLLTQFDCQFDGRSPLCLCIFPKKNIRLSIFLQPAVILKNVLPKVNYNRGTLLKVFIVNLLTLMKCLN